MRKLITGKVEKLERRFGRITACQVAIHAPDAPHKMGEAYSVAVQLALPNRRNVSVRRAPKGLDPRQSDVNFAVSDAFRRADRQLRDRVLNMKGRPTQHTEESKGRVLRLVPEVTAT